MQIVEVKNDIAKISYNSANNHLLPSDFVLIEDSFLKFIGQVVNIETTNDSVLNNANVRLCLFIDSDDNLSFYNGYIIGKNAKVNYINSDEIVELISDDRDNIYFGNLSNHTETFVKTSLSFINDKLYIQSDKNDKSNVIIQNIISQLVAKNKKVVILDFDGSFRTLENSLQLKINKDIKLPLNVQALDNIIEKDIEDCPIEDKAFIQGIILELREYIQTLPDNFLKFSLFRDVINAQYQENPISGLMILRNKLWLYAQDGIFADDCLHYQCLNSIVQNNSCIVIDASDVNEKWQNYTVQIIKDIIDENCYLFLNLDGLQTNKKFINDIYSKENIIPVIETSYSNPSRNLLGILSANQILCKSINSIDENVQYVDYLNKINQEEFILFGESTLYIPLVLSLQKFDASTFSSVIENDIKRDVDKLLTNSSSKITQNSEIVDSSPAKEEVEAEPELVEDIPIIVEDNLADDVSPIIEQNVKQNIQENISLEEVISDVNVIEQQLDEIEENIEDDDLTSSDFDFLDEIFFEEEQKNVEQNPENSNEVQMENNIPIEKVEEVVEDEVVVLSESENIHQSIDEVLIDNSDEIENIENIDNVDNVDDIEDINIETPSQHEMISDEDIVFQQEESIDEELNNEEDTVQEDTVEENLYYEEANDLQEETIELNEEIEEKHIPNIPIYETDVHEKLNQEDLPFKVGDKVYHPKHGNGIVRGFTNYSDKILFCQIEFENVGRRILDPRVAQLEKI